VLSKSERVLDVHPEIAHRALDLGVAPKRLAPVFRPGWNTEAARLRTYARLVNEWVTAIGLRREDYGTHSLRRTKASIIYKATGNLLPSSDVARVVGAAREGIRATRTGPAGPSSAV
jgi:hypothetical protein